MKNKFKVIQKSKLNSYFDLSAEFNIAFGAIKRKYEILLNRKFKNQIKHKLSDKYEVKRLALFEKECVYLRATIKGKKKDLE